MLTTLAGMTRSATNTQRKRWRPHACKVCGATRDETRISSRGLCEPCAIERISQPARELQAKSGPAYENWRAAMRRAVGE